MKQPTASPTKNKFSVVMMHDTSANMPYRVDRLSDRLGLRSQKNVVDAVYGHLQALRSLGRMEVSIADVANALGLPYDIVNDAMRDLSSRGVKPVR